MNLKNYRNIGISAHIDSGKTTLSERILFYCGRIHKIEDVRGGGDGATMDHMELEKERGITITSAATQVKWDDNTINLIDTPGHVDFTVEVERSLRVLDGAVLVLCAVGGVQAQSLTVDRQMKRYGIPRLAFVNKMDRTGADPFKVADQMREKLAVEVILFQIPIGLGENFDGVVDLIEMKAYRNDGDKGEIVLVEEIPAELVDDANKYRQELLEGLSMYSDEMMELLLSEEEVSKELIYTVAAAAIKSQSFTPMFMGTAFKNKSVQPLVDAVIRYLPNPEERKISAKQWDNPEEDFPLEPDKNKPLVGMAFKIVEDPFGQLTFMRVYQGTVKKGGTYYNQRTSRKERFSRIVRMHSNKREEIDEAFAGDIVAVMGIDCASGDTYSETTKYCSLENMFVPEPVISVAIAPADRGTSEKLGKALQRFRKEDPTFRVSTDEETAEVIISGMGELHLDVYVEPTMKAAFDYKHKKQSGGSGQFAHIKGWLEPLDEEEFAKDEDNPKVVDNFLFEDKIVSGRIPKQYIPAVEKGMRQSIFKGVLAEYPVVGMRMMLADGSYHDVDSSEMAFQAAARGMFREYMTKTKPQILEPVMFCEIECPEPAQGPIVGDLTSRRGIMESTDIKPDGSVLICCEIPLSETFGYATDLRSMSQGQATFTMELRGYRPVPRNVQEDIIDERRKAKEALQKA